MVELDRLKYAGDGARVSEATGSNRETVEDRKPRGRKRGPVHRAIGSFHPITVPALSRRNYSHELTYCFLFPAALAVIEGSVIAVIARNAFNGVVPTTTLNWAVSCLVAAPEVGNLSSFLWTRLSHGRDKVAFINVVQWATVLMVALIAVIPKTPTGLWLLVTAMIAARILLSGMFTLRSTIWRANYHRSERARATGKFSTITVLVTAAVAFVLGRAMDFSTDSFRVLIPLCALAGAIGASYYGKIRVRGRRVMLRAERQSEKQDRPPVSPIALVRLLIEDRAYGWFMGSMFVLGFGNLMLSAPLVIALKERFHQEYTGGIVIMHTIPYCIIPFFIPIWARLLSRVHVVRFRSIHSWVFVLAQGAVFVAVWTQSFWVLFISSAFLGAGYAGGSLAWNLGHLDFAPSHKATLYMGVHVTLNGVRGIIAPFVSVQLYQELESWGEGHGAWVFAISVVLCIAGGLGFWMLARSMGDGAKRTPREN